MRDGEDCFLEGSICSLRCADGRRHDPLQKEWAEKSARHYAEAQNKKWQRWNDAMFERYD